MNVRQWILVVGVSLFVTMVVAVFALVLYHVHLEQQYKMKQRYAPKTDEELEERAQEVIAQILAQQRQRDHGRHTNDNDR